MEKNYQSAWPEIVFSGTTAQASRKISHALKQGDLRKIAPRLYSSNLRDLPKDIVSRNLYQILGYLFPKAVVSHRSALEGGPTPDGTIFLTYKYTKKVQLPGITVRLLEGKSQQAGDMPFMGELFLASRPRAFLENMQQGRGKPAKVLSSADIEIRLDNLCRIHGESVLNQLRDEARDLSVVFGMTAEFSKLDKLMGGLLSTRKNEILKSSQGKARALGLPYDPNRIELFAKLFAHLTHVDLPPYPNRAIQDLAWQNLAFFEAYFSNYIEGTEFLIEEAAEIVFQDKINVSRPADSHDVLSTFRLVSGEYAGKTPETKEDFLQLLKARHAILMAGRADKNPGQFKEVNNRAGETVFVSPECVVGTLYKGFEYYDKLPKGNHRAIFMMFLVAEVHPFLDGNGRLARMMMNAELVAREQSKIIIPTVYREDYLLALRALSRQSQLAPYVSMLVKAQKYSHGIIFDSYEQALAQLRATNAFCEPFEAKLKFLS